MTGSIPARGCLLLAAALGAAPAFVAGQELALQPSVHGIEVGEARVREYALPVGAGVRLGPLRLDVLTAFARAELERPDGRLTAEGWTNATVRVVLGLFGDRARLIVAASLPPEDSRRDPPEAPVMAAVATELFTLPVSGFTTGPSVTGGLALAQRLGGGWTAGVVGTYRRGEAYEPYAGTEAGPAGEFRPGDEVRTRVALEGAWRAGWSVRLAGTFSRFGQDEADGAALLRPGNRYLGELVVDFPLGPGAGAIYGWNLYRDPGVVVDTVASEERSGRNLAAAGIRLRLPLGARISIRPLAEALVQTTPGTVAGLVQEGRVLRAGLAVALHLGTLTVEPAAIAQYSELDGQRVEGLLIRAGLAWIP